MICVHDSHWTKLGFLEPGKLTHVETGIDEEDIMDVAPCHTTRDEEVKAP